MRKAEPPTELLWVPPSEIADHIEHGDRPPRMRPVKYAVLAGGLVRIWPPLDPKKHRLYLREA